MAKDMEAQRQAKAQKKLLTELAAYAPEDVTNKEQYVQLVNQQVLGKDKAGNPRAQADLIYFLQVAKTTGLNPFTKQIYAIYRWNSRAGKETMSIQAGIDGLRAVAERTGLYAGSDEGVIVFDEDGKTPISATVTVYKLNKITGERMPTTATARWSEYAPSPLDGFWKNMPIGQLEKCAEAKALRKAFPNIAQVYTPEEMQQAEPIIAGEALPSVETRISNAKTKAELQELLHELPAADRRAVVAQINAKLREIK